MMTFYTFSYQLVLCVLFKYDYYNETDKKYKKLLIFFCKILKYYTIKIIFFITIAIIFVNANYALSLLIFKCDYQKHGELISNNVTSTSNG